MNTLVVPATLDASHSVEGRQLEGTSAVWRQEAGTAPLGSAAVVPDAEFHGILKPLAFRDTLRGA